jgi:hypothetical protein
MCRPTPGANRCTNAGRKPLYLPEDEPTPIATIALHESSLPLYDILPCTPL